MVQQTGDAFRDTLVLTICGDGVDLPPFFIFGQYGNAPKTSGRRPSPGRSPVSGMTIQVMKEYIDHIAPYVEETTILLMDRLSSHTSKKTKKYFQRWKTHDGQPLFIPLYLEPKSSFLVSPLDMGAIGEFKSYFYQLDRSTPELKKLATYQAWRQVSNDNLRKYFLNCGIIGEEDISSIHDRFIKEVRGGIPSQLEKIRDYYDSWRSGAMKVEGAYLTRDIPLELPCQLPSAKLDGKYWTEYGPHGKNT